MTSPPTAPKISARIVAIAASVAATWIAVLAASAFAPDLVSGSEQEHIPVTAFTAWFWGLISTVFILTLLLARTEAGGDRTWYGLAVAITGTWIGVGVFAIFGPELITGSDPTRVPVSGLLGPIIGTVLTGVACLFAALLAVAPSERGRA